MTFGVNSARRRAWFESGRWIPWTFVGGFVVVVAVNVTMLLLSLGSWPGLETEDAYEKGLAYNEVLDAAAAQATRGWTSRVNYEAGELFIDMTGADGGGIDGLRVTATLLRPTHEGTDQQATLQAVGGGRYAATIALPFEGNWDVRIHTEGIGKPWFGGARIWVR
jgi:nitrogen fixation protein FixH